MRLNGTTIASQIKLSSTTGKDPEPWVQVLRVGSFAHPLYGNFEITTQTLAEMKGNFDAKIRGIDLAFDFYHESDKEAAAWVNSLELREGGTELWANVTWTPKANQMLAERAIRYFSPDFAFEWQDPESGTVYKNVLFGGGLTNRPFVKEMAAIVADELKGVNMKKVEELQAEIDELKKQNIKLGEDCKAMEQKMADMPPADDVAALKAKIAELEAALQKAKADGEAMMAEKKKLEEAKALSEKETAFNLLLTEGKAVVAQKEAFIKGDMTEFIKLAQPINMRGAGSSTGIEPGSDVEQIIKLAEEMEKTNPKLTRGESISLAKKQLKK